MILVFLGSCRYTLIIAVSIPLSILVSLILLGELGETINILTLGGLALAVGILVDVATVEIESMNRNLEVGKEIEQAILDGAAQIAIPAFVSTCASSICIVFVPMFFLGGVARSTSSCRWPRQWSSPCSRPTSPAPAYRGPHHGEVSAGGARRRSAETRSCTEPQPVHPLSARLRAALRTASASSITVCLGLACRPQYRLPGFIFLLFCSGLLRAALRRGWAAELLPFAVDAGQFKLHVRARTGTRIEETAALCDQIDNRPSGSEIPARGVGQPSSITSVLPYFRPEPLLWQLRVDRASEDADITVSLTKKDHRPTNTYVEDLRARAGPGVSPGVTFYSLPVDMTSPRS